MFPQTPAATAAISVDAWIMSRDNTSGSTQSVSTKTIYLIRTADTGHGHHGHSLGGTAFRIAFADQCAGLTTRRQLASRTTGMSSSDVRDMNCVMS